MSRTDGVGESSMLGTWISQGSETKLANSSQSLHFTGFEEIFDDSLLVGLESDQTVDGITQDHGVVFSQPTKARNHGRTPAVQRR
ncbi:MAG TPA: hypothetical protein PLM08_08315 [Polyangiaceae bacterium]|nr:hypothetical protein [Polyangiaceae bacterium]